MNVCRHGGRGWALPCGMLLGLLALAALPLPGVALADAPSLSVPAPSLTARAPVILVYHAVGAGPHGTLGVSAAGLRERILALRAHGLRFGTTSQVAAGEAEASLQFDDGLASVYGAFAVLRELGVPGTVYVIASRVGTPGFLDREQLRELQAAGWEIGHHTHSHAALSDLTPASLARELSPLPDFAARCVAYPYNRHDARVRRERPGRFCRAGSRAGSEKRTTPRR